MERQAKPYNLIHDLVICAMLLFTSCLDSRQTGQDLPLIVENDSSFQLVESPHINIIRAHCTGCHSERLITQNRASREGWESMIVWMQETQNLWDLEENEEIILDYLEANYGREERGRRSPLQEIDWYVLE